MRWKIYRTPLIVLILGLVITAVIAQGSYKRDINSVLTQLSMDADEYGSTLASEADRSLIVLETLSSFLSASAVSRDVFFSVAKDSLQQYPQLQSVVWIPYVEASEREAFEQAERAYTPDFEFKEVIDQRLGRSPARDYYYPIYYQYGKSGPDQSTGYDLASGVLGPMLDQAKDSGGRDYLIDMRPRFFQSVTGQSEVEHFLVVIIPVYDEAAGNAEASPETFKGFLMGAVRVEEILARYLQDNSYEHIDFSVLDITSDEQTVVVAIHEESDGGQLLEQYDYTTNMDIVGNRLWQLNATPSHHYIDLISKKSWRYVVSIGTLLSVMLAGYLYNMRSRETVVEALVEQQTAELRSANIKLAQLSRTDALTQLANRRYFDEYLQTEWFRARREKRPLSLLLCDVDYFKPYNDRYGHPEGDRCLQHVALGLRGCFSRSGDLVARYGGEEFAVVMPSTELEEDGLLEKCRSVIEELRIPHGGSAVSSYVTISLGACTVFPSEDLEIGEIISAADQALYRAKLEGRNRAVLFDFSQEQNSQGLATSL